MFEYFADFFIPSPFVFFQECRRYIVMQNGFGCNFCGQMSTYHCVDDSSTGNRVIVMRGVANQHYAISNNIMQAIAGGYTTRYLGKDTAFGKFPSDEFVQVIYGEFTVYSRGIATDTNANVGDSFTFGKNPCISSWSNIMTDVKIAKPRFVKVNICHKILSTDINIT